MFCATVKYLFGSTGFTGGMGAIGGGGNGLTGRFRLAASRAFDSFHALRHWIPGIHSYCQ